MSGNLQEELKIALQIDADVRTHKEELLLLIGNMQAMQRKKKRIGFFEFMLRQIRFMGKNLWLTQGAAAFAMFGIGYLLTGKDIEGLCIRHIPLLLGVFAIMQVMASIPLLLTSYRYQMHEIEMASRISLPRLLMAKLIILAVEYLAVFVFCVGLSAGMAGMPAVSLALYFVFPLLAACTGCVQIIRHTEGWEEVAGRVGACEGYCVCLGAVFIVLYGMKPVLYGNVRLWMLLMAGLFPLFILLMVFAVTFFIGVGVFLGITDLVFGVEGLKASIQTVWGVFEIPAFTAGQTQAAVAGPYWSDCCPLSSA